MSKMIEKVSKAIENEFDKYDELIPNITLARAAILAMREPTEEMLEILRKQGGIDGYQAMIDAALKE